MSPPDPRGEFGRGDIDRGQIATALSAISAELYGAVHDAAVGPPTGDDPAVGWIALRSALEPDNLHTLIDDSCRRWSTADRVTAGSLLVREWDVALSMLLVAMWRRDVVLDLSLDNLAMRSTAAGSRLALVAARLDDRPAPETVLDETIPATIDALRAVMAVGSRHLWGNVALSIANSFTTASHEMGSAADEERERYLDHRPELRRTIELVTFDDRLGGEMTGAVRRTCCLLDKVDPLMRCATCSLNERSVRLRSMARYYRAERAGQRGPLGPA